MVEQMLDIVFVPPKEIPSFSGQSSHSYIVATSTLNAKLKSASSV